VHAQNNKESVLVITMFILFLSTTFVRTFTAVAAESVTFETHTETHVGVYASVSLCLTVSVN
jgi:hypothetical protein